jgi:bifunctional UDP-N-acetylglucosamine pyrophosphorylase / glucosamine-1-phosphate N-acetyltransferase
MSDRHLACVVLAAGEGKRMRSTRPKPLHLLCGRAMLLHVLDRLAEADADRAVVVVGHGAERVSKALIDDGPPHLHIDFVEQHVQRGTGDAAALGLSVLPDDEDEIDVLIAHGDQPLVQAATLRRLIDFHRASGAAGTVLSVRLPDPTGYGRIVHGKDGAVTAIVEQRDASHDELYIDETNTGFYCFKRSLLAPALRRILPNNEQGELYLTDVIAVLAGAGHRVEALEADDPGEMLGINDRAQLAAAEAELRRRTNAAWLAKGVTMLDPSTVYIDATVSLGSDVTLFPDTILQGMTSVGDRSEIGPGTRLVDVHVGTDCRVQATVAEGAEIGDGAQVGPFAHLPSGTSIASGQVTGAFYTPR